MQFFLQTVLGTLLLLPALGLSYGGPERKWCTSMYVGTKNAFGEERCFFLRERVEKDTH